MPFDNLEELTLLIREGADEFYCGVFDLWLINITSRSRRIANLRSYNELGKAVKLCHKHNRNIYFCANNYFRESLIMKEIKKAIKAGVNGVIISNHLLVPYIKELDKDCKIILSCMNPCFNTDSLRFFKKLGVDRIVLDRQLRFNELEILCKNANEINLELEIFVLNIVCRNINGNCYHDLLNRIPNRFSSIMIHLTKQLIIPEAKKREIFTYNNCLQPCMRIYNFSCWSQKNNDWLFKNIYFCLDKNNYYFCALCSLYYLNSFSLCSVKIIGRGLATEKKVKDLQLIKTFMNLIETGEINKNNFLEEGQKYYLKVYGRRCHSKECHHPEIYRLKASKL